MTHPWRAGLFGLALVAALVHGTLSTAIAAAPAQLTAADVGPSPADLGPEFIVASTGQQVAQGASFRTQSLVRAGKDTFYLERDGPILVRSFVLVAPDLAAADSVFERITNEGLQGAQEVPSPGVGDRSRAGVVWGAGPFDPGRKILFFRARTVVAWLLLASYEAPTNLDDLAPVARIMAARAAGSPLPAPVAFPTLVAPPPAPGAPELATVLAFGGSDKLLVRNEAGLSYRVQVIGVRGPVRSSLQHGEASAFIGPLVAGQRVLLEPDGKDQEEGYALRHVYLESNPMPLGGMAVAAGLATAVPYPVEHRHRELYLQLQQQTMAGQIALWQPGLLGPAAPWRPPDGEAGYIAADPELHRFFDLLASVPTGRSVLARLVRTTPTMLYRELPAGLGGYADARGYQVVMSRGLGSGDPRSMAAAIAHEGTHVIDYAAGALDLATFSCFELEQRAHAIQAQVWAELVGPAGKPNPQDNWDRASNDVLGFAQRNDLENYVRRSAGYEAQCARERPA